MSKIIKDIKKILEGYGYSFSSNSNLSIETIEIEDCTQFNILTQSGSIFVCGLLLKNDISTNPTSVLKNILSNIHNCTLGFIYDGIKVTGYQYKSDSADLIKLREFECYNLYSNTLKYEVFGKNKKLIPLTSELENLFFQMHSHIRDIDGMHADEALDELCKMIYTKLYDEEHHENKKTFHFQKAIYGNAFELSTAIHSLYQEANEYDKRVFSLKIPDYKRSRGVFDHPIMLSAPTISKITEQLEKVNLSSSALDIKGRAFQNVFLPSLRAGMGQYFTPASIVEMIVKSSNPDSRSLILDPFSGSGKFLTTSLDFIRASGLKNKVIDEFAYYKLHGIEKSERMVRIAMTDMRLHGDGHANIRCTDSLLSFDNYHDIEPNSFDYVFTNPPFGSLLGESALKSLGEFELAEGRKTVPLEILGLERAIQFLKDNGKLAIVIPDSILVNDSMKYVRDWLTNNITINAIVSLPIETFSIYGANIKTSIMFLKKSKSTNNNKVLCATINNIGYDAAGRTRKNSDLNVMTNTLREHLNNEGWS